MGSSGSDSFSDYSEQKPTSPKTENGGSSKNDKCKNAFATSLEEVSRCAYYKRKKTMPPIGLDVIITFNGTRLAATESSSGLEIGYLPTKFNYLKNCMDNGFAYSGVVRTITLRPTPSVLTDIVPS